MTELKLYFMLHYNTSDQDKYIALVLKNNKILSLKSPDKKNTILYDSIIEWLETLPNNVSKTKML